VTSPLAEPTTSGRKGFAAGIPRGARLDERHFAGRHRIIAAVLAASG
jgi:methyl-accepting chemotaxis protein